MCRFRVRFPDSLTASRGYAVLTISPRYARHSELVLTLNGDQLRLLASCGITFDSLREEGMVRELIVEAPGHRYLSVLALLYECKVIILNEEELRESALSRGLLRFRIKATDTTDLKIGLAELEREHEEKFSLMGAGQ